MTLTMEKKSLARAMVEEADHQLRHKPVKATTLERIRLFDQAYEQVRNEPQPKQYGKGLLYVTTRISLPITPRDLLLGRVQEEVPDAEGEAYLQSVCLRFGRLGPGSKDSRPPFVYDSGHASLYWRDVIRLGLSGLQARAEAELKKRIREKADQRTLDFLEGAILCYQALRVYLRRYADAAERAGLPEAADACRRGAEQAPDSFRGSLQMLLAIIIVYCSYLATNPTLTFGRLDQLLYPLYRKDLSQGVLTRDEAGLLILDFYCKNNLNMGRGEHQLGLEDENLSTGWMRNLNFDAPQYLILGGSDQGGQPASNDLTLLFAEQIQPQFKNPVVVVRYTKGMAKQHPRLWRALSKSMRDSASLMIYNDANVISAMIQAGVDKEDAIDFEHFGCNWPCLPGISAAVNYWIPPWTRFTDTEALDNAAREQNWVDAPGGLPGYLMQALHETPDDAQIDSVDFFYEKVRESFRQSMRAQMKQCLWLRERKWMEAPGILQLMDCFFRDTIPLAKSFMCGGSKYATVNRPFRGFATLVDSFSAIDTLLFQEKAVSFGALKRALGDDFSGCEQIALLCRNAPKLGDDDPRSNSHGVKTLAMLSDTVYEVQKEFADQSDVPVVVFQCIQTDTLHIAMGKALGATPDGRRAGAPLSQNCQPVPGACTGGLTARFRAIAQLPFDRIASGAQNVNVSPATFRGEIGLQNLASVTATYFELGGHQLQLSTVDVNELKDAQLYPDRHRDLMVRVTGYSAVFVDMCRMAQDDVIRREMDGTEDV